MMDERCEERERFHRNGGVLSLATSNEARSLQMTFSAGDIILKPFMHSGRCISTMNNYSVNRRIIQLRLLHRLLIEAARVLDISNDYAIPSDEPGGSPSPGYESVAIAQSAEQGTEHLPSLTAAAERKRFLELSVLMHPDKNPHPLAEQVGQLAYKEA